MRVKEFILFIIVFTILYILFFVIWDYIHSKKDKKREIERLSEIFMSDKISSFMKFYGVENFLVNPEVLQTIYQDIKDLSTISISAYSEKYHFSSYEFIIIVLYFEYYQLISRKNISLKEDVIRSMDSMDQQLIMKYGSFFLSQYNYSQIVEMVGDIASGELEQLNQHFLYPGVRIINSTIYYVGDVYEKN